MNYYWFRCPGCKQLAQADDDQVKGRVSILCDCGWHETGQIEPKLLSNEKVDLDQQFTFTKK